MFQDSQKYRNKGNNWYFFPIMTWYDVPKHIIMLQSLGVSVSNFIYIDVKVLPHKLSGISYVTNLSIICIMDNYTSYIMLQDIIY